jgi:drug/metabolite transporter (DMT)-like permease
MEALALTVEPGGVGAPRRRRPARRRVTKRVQVPPPASLPMQILGLLILLALCAAGIFVLAKSDSTVAQLAAGVVLFLAAFVLIVWAAAALGTGLGPKQLIALATAFFGAVRDATKPSDESGDDTEQEDKPDKPELDQPATPGVQG